MFEEPIANRIILAVFPPGEDRRSLNQILNGSQWRLRFTSTFEETRTALRNSSLAVVLSEGVLADGYDWKDILLELQIMSNPPTLIVADRLADDALWAEVLNLGAYDLLMKPFSAKELLHALTTACHFGEDQRERESELGKPMKPVRSDDVSGTRSTPALAAGG